jgi:hypothetical protein
VHVPLGHGQVGVPGQFLIVGTVLLVIVSAVL